ncbi:tetratricopeptide repeat protein [Pseudobacteriovorax antillogorgiicola]|uniref:Uncharacterized protein n=1 Tax=Pseudobacteriovorax antillogorgiicola TaxID=1513793 RepID=A0A1Y6B4U1_9BACT|nr:hypothetical protein [Pseudobacteriovorax antillogorgiicola]TCS59516.1 hypothetical protein EDD56_101436 [Pseudobacteriovorax antillogorgiicola]SME87872.1 hypothetical protein SAMN06296036_10149 [Pseudobacteriovorax antillogorgiicola]
MKISIVMADRKDLHLVELFKGYKEIELEVLLLNNHVGLPASLFDYPIKLFDPVDDMPQYFRGLSNQLKHCDIVVVVDPHYRSSFQSLSAACKLNKPLILLQTIDSCPFIDETSEDFRTTMQLMRAADFIFATNERVREYLLTEGVQTEKISVTHPEVSEQLRFDSRLRTKFRRYVQLDMNTTLLFTHSNHTERIASLLRALRFFLRRKPTQCKHIKLMIASEEDTDGLKYLASDLGIGSQLMFINQDTRPFFHDLCSAMDIAVDLDSMVQGWMSPWLREAAACDVLPILGSSGDSDYLENFGIVASDGSYLGLSEALEEAVGLFKYQGREAGKIAGQVRRHQGQKSHRELFLNVMSQVMKGYGMESRNVQVDYESQRILVEQNLSLGHRDSVLDGLSLMMSLAGQDFIKKSEAYRIKGDAHLRWGAVELAMEAYDIAVQLNDRNWEAYLGLGKVSLRSHTEEDALMFFKKVLAYKPNQAEALAGVGTVHRMLGMAEDSLYWFHRALCLDMTNEKLLFKLTQAALECEEWEEPIHILESMRDSFGERQCLVMALGRLYLNAGKIEEGKEMVARALESASLDKT